MGKREQKCFGIKFSRKATMDAVIICEGAILAFKSPNSNSKWRHNSWMVHLVL